MISKLSSSLDFSRKKSPLPTPSNLASRIKELSGGVDSLLQ